MRSSKTKIRPRTVVWSTRLTSGEAKALKSVARKSKQNRSGFTRSVLLDYIS